MATQSSSSPQECCLAVEDQLEFQSIPQGLPSSIQKSESLSSQQDYDFIDEPDQDY